MIKKRFQQLTCIPVGSTAFEHHSNLIRLAAFYVWMVKICSQFSGEPVCCWNQADIRLHEFQFPWKKNLQKGYEMTLVSVCFFLPENNRLTGQQNIDKFKSISDFWRHGNCFVIFIDCLQFKLLNLTLVIYIKSKQKQKLSLFSSGRWWQPSWSQIK